MYQSAATDVPLVARVPQFDKPCSSHKMIQIILGLNFMYYLLYLYYNVFHIVVFHHEEPVECIK
jgi:hypothetical protein